MGSDLSYEDLMEDPRLEHSYTAAVSGTEDVDGRRCWTLDLTAKVEGLAYLVGQLEWVLTL
ncbi:MAG TPA: outer membrane lipoprotein-sorting protein [Gemmatimonadales bacterium]|nr:outer membrane lipoprotein-sorting protein [Gemmatimonadales bacterium]